MAYFPAASAFPRVARVVRSELPAIPKDAKKFKALMDFGQLTASQARAALQPGSGPTIRTKYLGAGTFGQYNGGDELWLSEVIARQYEKVLESWHNAHALGQARGADHARWLKLVQQATRVVESTILHEMVHWGDRNADGLTRDLEAMRLGWKDVGHMFVSYAYGNHFAVQKEKLRRNLVVKLPDVDIAGWMGWDRQGRAFDPWKNMGPASGPVAPPR